MDEKREPLIEFKGVSKTFGTRNILNKIDFSIYEGEVTTLTVSYTHLRAHET